MPAPVRPMTPLRHPISQRLHEQRTRGERLADTISDQIGSWRFLVIQTVVIMAEHDYATNEHAEQLTEALLSELLRNSQATLAIAGFHGIELEALVAHENQLVAKVDAVQEQLAEVEDVLIAAAEAAEGNGQGLFGGIADTAATADPDD